MRILGFVFGGLLVLLVGAMVVQHFRYLDWRRNVIHDQQPMFYGSDTFHTATVFQLGPGQDLLETLGETRSAIEGSHESLWIYAGKTAFVGLQSAQVGEAPWDGFVLIQYPSRAAYDAAAADPETARAWQGYARTYTVGMKRPMSLNLAVPQGLLALKIASWLGGTERVDIHDREDEAVLRERGIDDVERFAKLDEALAISRDAAVVFNLNRNGSDDEQAANSDYGLTMIRQMAMAGHGPAHIAIPVIVEGDARFDSIAIVYYPGLPYFTSLMQSRFFQGIVGGKQLGDAIALPTVPILDRI
jgi:hypothetical protein